MFPLLSIFRVVDELRDFIGVMSKEIARYLKKTSRALVLDSMTGRAECLMGMKGGHHPLPAPLMVYGVAFRTPHRLFQFFMVVIGVMIKLPKVPDLISRCMDEVILSFHQEFSLVKRYGQAQAFKPISQSLERPRSLGLMLRL